MALRAFSPYTLALLLLSSASSPPSISADTARATSALPNRMASSPNSSTGAVTPIGTPTPSTSTASRSFRNWSEKCGHVTS
uniref:Secreted protein n=1 Tax=Oryza brachyantha TaxID=4533 RepID=J3LAS4_ORYBR